MMMDECWMMDEMGSKGVEWYGIVIDVGDGDGGKLDQNGSTTTLRSGHCLPRTLPTIKCTGHTHTQIYTHLQAAVEIPAYPPDIPYMHISG